MKIWRYDQLTDEEVKDLDFDEGSSVGSYTSYTDDEFINLPKIDSELGDKIFETVVDGFDSDEFYLTPEELKECDLDTRCATVLVIYDCKTPEELRKKLGNNLKSYIKKFRKIKPDIYIYHTGDPFDGDVIMINEALKKQIEKNSSKQIKSSAEQVDFYRARIQEFDALSSVVAEEILSKGFVLNELISSSNAHAYFSKGILVGVYCPDIHVLYKITK